MPRAFHGRPWSSRHGSKRNVTLYERGLGPPCRTADLDPPTSGPHVWFMRLGICDRNSRPGSRIARRRASVQTLPLLGFALLDPQGSSLRRCVQVIAVARSRAAQPLVLPPPPGARDPVRRLGPVLRCLTTEESPRKRARIWAQLWAERPSVRAVVVQLRAGAPARAWQTHVHLCQGDR